MAREPDLRTVIVGAGFGGIAAAISLRDRGFTDTVILDSAPGIGGTWLHNTYPGAACDVPSHLYSYSFAQRRDWERLCPLQEDILAYIRDVAHEHGVDRLVVPDTRVSACRWNDITRTWKVTAEDGRTWEADALVLATGQLHQPHYPRIEGIGDFAGHSFHSAEWDHGWDPTGRRIGVIGTGASAVQFLPEIARQAAHVTVFQRTGNWFMPRRNRRYPKPIALAIRWIPGVQSFRRRFIFEYGEMMTAMIRHPRTLGLIGRLRSSLFMRWQLRGDPQLRERVWPRYTFGCKRVLFSSSWLPTLRRDNVELVTEPISHATRTGLVTADGTIHELDCLIHGTGFNTSDFMFPMEVIGREGLRLRDAWADGAHAHLGMTVPGFPSMFLMYGPNTNTSGGSIIVYLEAQARYLGEALSAVATRGDRAVDVRPEVESASDRETQERFAGTAWVRCDSWYRDDAGRVVANWPGYMREYLDRTSHFEPSEYRFIPAAPAAGGG